MRKRKFGQWGLVKSETRTLALEIQKLEIRDWKAETAFQHYYFVYITLVVIPHLRFIDMLLPGLLRFDVVHKNTSQAPGERSWAAGGCKAAASRRPGLE